jgi:KaiC/GvpD/RAD55 family RecA-like ATPase
VGDPVEAESSAKAIVRICGDYGSAVDAAAHLGRALWAQLFEKEAFPARPETRRRTHGRTVAKVIPRDKLLSQLSWGQRGAELSEEVFRRLENEGLLVPDPADPAQWLARLDVFQPFKLARCLVGGLRPDHDLRYFTMRSIRTHYDCVHSERIVHDFSRLAEALGRLKPVLPHLPKKRRSSTAVSDATEAEPAAQHSSKAWPRAGRRHFHYEWEVLPPLEEALVGERADPGQSIALFLECCRVVGYIGASAREGCIFRQTAAIDVEYLIATLFALTTGIRGFDELFGGSGLLLGQPRRGDRDELPGRMILVTGPFGAGKSLLSLQIAVEVARKGGVALFLLMEQTPDECLFMLESIGSLRDDGAMDVATDNERAAELLLSPRDGRGALIILRLSKVKDSLERFLIELTRAASQIIADGAHPFPLRIVVVDPINSVYMGKANTERLRSRMLQVFQRIRVKGTNLLLVAEESSHPSRGLRIEQNIADTVIHLAVERAYGYSQRTFSILKSRLQREQRGEHPFSIAPGSGVNIYPTPAAVAARIRDRSVLPPDTPVSFGLPSLNAILGEKAIAAGDVIVLDGPGGTYKKELAMTFLLSAEPKRPEAEIQKRAVKSLLIAVYTPKPSVEKLLHAARSLINDENSSSKHPNCALKREAEIVIHCLPRGHVQPGFILDSIENEFIQAEIEGFRFDRVLIDDVDHWEMSCPFVRDDETFGDTLLAYLRQKHVTTLLVCQELTGQVRSMVQQSFVSGADCLLTTERFHYRGQSQILLRVSRTRGQGHRRDAFELDPGKGQMIKPQASLLRVEANDQVREVKIRLFLNTESEMQRRYNDTLAGALKSVLSREVELDTQDQISLGRVLDLGASSVVDELQIIQLDEFQLQPRFIHGDSKHSPLFEFSRRTSADQTGPASADRRSDRDDWEQGDWDRCFSRLVGRVQTASGFVAIPFYTNVGLLAYLEDTPKLSGAVLSSWEGLAEACREFEGRNADITEIFFDCPRVPHENYNCFFFEILLALDPELAEEKRPNLAEWLDRPKATEAARILRQLCHRGYLLHRESDPVTAQARLAADQTLRPHPQGLSSSVRASQVNPRARVWRHWYTTLNQMLAEMSPVDQRRVKVRLLPGEVAVAGEWYLAIPSYSAAPDVGLAIIRHLTRREAEFDRVWAGIGMPTRRSFFSDPASAERGVSPFFTLDGARLGELIDHAFMRSRILGYEQVSRSLALHLVEIIRLPESEQVGVERGIKAILDDLKVDMNYILQLVAHA